MRLPNQRAGKIFAIAIAFAVVLAVLFISRGLWGSSRTAPAERPIVKAAGEIDKLIKALPSYAPFSLTGIAFYKGHVYAGTNVGLIELKDSVPLAV
jgi:hypothetical protein